ncbi:MAG: exodeoxyribonuclease VII large subunit [Cytophagales bacterium]|nr:exodeoxyribonuclease VII large subunit [Cytophagales bacterium]
MPDQFSLSQLCQLIQKTIEKDFSQTYWVVAEIAELRVAQAGHCYMELVEKTGQQLTSKIRANIWAYTYRNVNGWFRQLTGSNLSAGMKILANVSVQYHPLYGISLNVNDIDPQFTLGDRERRKQEVIKTLKEEGIFDMNHSLILPSVVQRIALISSPTAAGYGDFMEHLINNPYGYYFEVSLFPSLMQGEKAQDSLVQTLYDIYDRVEEFDAVAVIRGGGAQTDFECFDSYQVAAHVAQFPLPVLAGIGHERDSSITDMVSCRSLKTPTAVADMLLNLFLSYESSVSACFDQLVKLSKLAFKQQEISLQQDMRKLFGAALGKLNSRKLWLNVRQQQLKMLAMSEWKKENKLLNDQAGSVKTAAGKVIQSFRDSLVGMEKMLELLDPKKVLERGYSITTVNGKSAEHWEQELAKGEAVIRSVSKCMELEGELKNVKTRKESWMKK